MVYILKLNILNQPANKITTRSEKLHILQPVAKLSILNTTQKTAGKELQARD